MRHSLMNLGVITIYRPHCSHVSTESYDEPRLIILESLSEIPKDADYMSLDEIYLPPPPPPDTVAQYGLHLRAVSVVMNSWKTLE